MKSLIFKALFVTVLTLPFVVSTGCKNDDPSVLKIYVRSASNQLIQGAKVVIIGDLNSNPPTLEHVDTLVTNASGFVTFDMDKYFEKTEETTGYFDLVVKKDTKTADGRVRCREHITTVETIFLPN